MKAQKLGLVLGINMMAVCLTMQGCKATKTGKPAPRQPQPHQTITVISSSATRNAPVVAPVAEPQVVQQPVQPVAVVSTLPPPVEPAPVEPVPVVNTPPAPPPAAPVAKTRSSVREIKPLPPTPPKTPKAKAKPAAAPAAETSEYVVKSGDTLFLISKRTNYRQTAILAANPGLNPDRLRVGQKIKMPGALAAAPAVAKVAAAEAKPADKGNDGKVVQAAAPSPAAANTQAPVKTKNAFVAYEGPTKDYVVKGGDSLGKIASEYGISIRALKALNGLQKNQLRAGQKLKVPVEKQTAASSGKAPAAKTEKPVTVEAGATIPPKDAAGKPAPVAAPETGKPATEAKPAVDAKPVEAKPAADTKPVEAKPVEEEKPVAEAPVPQPPAEKPLPTYTVKEGDDLVSIAIAFGISPSALMDINDLKPTDEIKVGQVLKLPANAKVNVQ